MQEGHGITHIGLDDLAHLQQVLEELVCVDAGLVIHVLEENVFDLDSVVEMLFQAGLVEQIADLDADLGVLVGVEGGDAALGGAEGMAAQALLFVGVLEDVIRLGAGTPASSRLVSSSVSLRMSRATPLPMTLVM